MNNRFCIFRLWQRTSNTATITINIFAVPFSLLAMLLEIIFHNQAYYGNDLVYVGFVALSVDLRVGHEECKCAGDNHDDRFTHPLSNGPYFNYCTTDNKKGK